MSNATVTEKEMEAIKDQRDCLKRSLNTVIKASFYENITFLEQSEPLNRMSAEQIVLAWHGHIKVEQNFVSFDEAMVASDEGKTVYFHSEDGDVKSIKQYEYIDVALMDLEVSNETLVGLLRGKWSIGD